MTKHIILTDTVLDPADVILVVRGALPQAITDELYTLLVGKKMIDVATAGSFDLEGFRGVVKEGLNRRFGAEVIAEVYVEQIDYLTTASVENPPQKQGVTLLKGEVPAVESTEKSSGGH